ncbi:MAG: hypothetical protein ACH0QD_13255 [Tepidibacillus sp.]
MLEKTKTMMYHGQRNKPPELTAWITHINRHIEELHVDKFDIEPFVKAYQTIFAKSHPEEQITSIKSMIDSLKEDPSKKELIYETLAQFYQTSQAKKKRIVDTIYHYLFKNAYGSITIPEDFWNTQLGQQIRIYMQDEVDVLITSGDAANLLGVSRQYIHEEIKKEKIPAQTVGKYSVLHLKDVIMYNQEKRGESL